MPTFARCHRDDDNNLVEVSCRCKTCCSKSTGGNGFSFGTVEYWLAGHELNAWKDPLGSGFHVVAIKSCTEKFLEKVHPEEYAKGARFWMNSRPRASITRLTSPTLPIPPTSPSTTARGALIW
jgi:hypothetical protein